MLTDHVLAKQMLYFISYAHVALKVSLGNGHLYLTPLMFKAGTDLNVVTPGSHGPSIS